MFVNIYCTTVYCPLNIIVDFIDVCLFSNFIIIFFFIDYYIVDQMKMLLCVELYQNKY